MKFESVTSTCVVLMRDDIDTDQIIPARFLSGISRDGLRDGLFHGLRFPGGDSIDATFPLNSPSARGAAILIAGANFGCGSSREHAAWALQDWGFRAVIAASFGDIFCANALKNGLLPVALPRAELQAAAEAALDGHTLAVDLRALQVRLHDGTSFAFTTDAFSRRCLLDGVDELGYLLAQQPHVEAFERSRP